MPLQADEAISPAAEEAVMVTPNFGWDYPPGAPNDPHAPWNQPDPDPCEDDHDPVAEEWDEQDYLEKLYEDAEERAIAKWERDRDGW